MAAIAAQIVLVGEPTAFDLPVDIGGVDRRGIGLVVETDVARGSLEVHQLAMLQGIQVELHRRGAPGSTAELLCLGGGELDDGGVELSIDH